MKIRTDFVTNSSSSSFVVVFPEEPASSGQVETMLFDKIGALATEYESYEGHTTREAADVIYRDIVNQKKATMTRIAEEFEYLDDYKGDPRPQNNLTELRRHNIGNLSWTTYETIGPNPKYHLGIKTYTRSDGSTYESNEYDWDLLYKDIAQWSKEKAKLFMKEHKGKFIYIFSYADDGGEGWLEHGNLFDKLPHIRISH